MSSVAAFPSGVTSPIAQGARPRRPDPAACADGAQDSGDDDGVVVTLSPEAAAAGDGGRAKDDDQAADGVGRARGQRLPGQLNDKEQAMVRELQSRDAEVRVHEASHVAASGGLGGRPSFTYQTGPDGRRYATGGEVSIDMSAGRTPSETIARAQSIRAAALAPASPSAQDRSVAAAAASMEARARAEELEQRLEAMKESTSPRASGPGAAHDSRDPAESRPSPDVARERDASDVVTRLASERRTTQAGWGHAHDPDGCGFCGRAAAAYR
jgi:hypothetical protein